MKIFLVIFTFFLLPFFSFVKDKTEEPKKVEIKLDKNVIVENLKKKALLKL